MSSSIRCPWARRLCQFKGSRLPPESGRGSSFIAPMWFDQFVNDYGRQIINVWYPATASGRHMGMLANVPDVLEPRAPHDTSQALQWNLPDCAGAVPQQR